MTKISQEYEEQGPDRIVRVCIEGNVFGSVAKDPRQTVIVIEESGEASWRQFGRWFCPPLLAEATEEDAVYFERLRAFADKMKLLRGGPTTFIAIRNGMGLRAYACVPYDFEISGADGYLTCFPAMRVTPWDAPATESWQTTAKVAASG